MPTISRRGRNSWGRLLCAFWALLSFHTLSSTRIPEAWSYLHTAYLICLFYSNGTNYFPGCNSTVWVMWTTPSFFFFKVKWSGVGHNKTHRKQRCSVKHYNDTHQYGVPMKVPLLCKVFVFFADTPKSAEEKGSKYIKSRRHIAGQMDGTEFWVKTTHFNQNISWWSCMT